MVNPVLVIDYLKRAQFRFEMLDDLIKKHDYADVISFSQEIVKLCEKAILIKLGITPPKLHDVIDIIFANLDKIPEEHRKFFLKVKKDCKWLRAQRELAFYGAMDFILLEDYTLNDAKRAKRIAQKFLEQTKLLILQDFPERGKSHETDEISYAHS